MLTLARLFGILKQSRFEGAGSNDYSPALRSPDPQPLDRNL
jgi:hypothetical protein